MPWAASPRPMINRAISNAASICSSSDLCRVGYLLMVALKRRYQRKAPMSSSQATTRKQRRSGAHGRDLSGFCPRFHHAVELIGRRWTGAIVRALCGGPLRVKDLLSTIPRLSGRLVDERVQELDR